MKLQLRTVLLQAIVLTGLALASPAQRTSVDIGQESPDTNLALPDDQLVMRYYTPRAVDTAELMRFAKELFGGSILVAPAKVIPGQPRETRWLDHFLSLEESIIIRDRADRAEAIAAQLASVEDAIHPRDDEARPASAQPELESLEYAPRFLSVRSLLRALESYHRPIDVPPPFGRGTWTQMDNITSFEERHLIIVRDEPERIAEIRAFLERLDVPASQASFSFLVIQGKKEGVSSPELPAELVEHLGRLVPMKSFELLSTGMLRGTVRDDVSIDTVSTEDIRYELELEPAAFDAATGTLTLRQCAFTIKTKTYTPTRDDQGIERETFSGWDQQGFETALSLRNGEYTVLGAIGSDPVFVVLRMSVQ